MFKEIFCQKTNFLLRRMTLRSSKNESDTFVPLTQYKEFIILQQPKCSMGDLIQFIKGYEYKTDLYIKRVGLFSGRQWSLHKTSHLFAFYLIVFSKLKVKQRYKFDQYIDKYYANIPSVADIQQIYRPYLDHILAQIVENNITTTKMVIDRFHILMNIPLLMGPIKTLSMHKKDLFVFGFIHQFQNEYKFYDRIIPWDVIKIIHLFYNPMNKEYLEKFENIKREIINIESQINHLKKQNDHKEVQKKQFELFAAYSTSRDISFQESYTPHCIDEYLVNTPEYQLSVHEFVLGICEPSMPFQEFEAIYNEHMSSYIPWGISVSSDMEELLMGLLEKIIPSNVLLDKQRIYRQFKMFADYIGMKTRYSSYEARGYHSKMYELIQEVMSKNNKWTDSVKKAVDESPALIDTTFKSTGFTSYQYKFDKGRVGKSFTID